MLIILGDDTHALCLPYVGDHASFVALKTANNEAFSDWEKDLGRERFDELIDGFEYGRGKITLSQNRSSTSQAAPNVRCRNGTQPRQTDL